MAASHGQFVDVLAMATTGTKGPTNVTRIAADANGNLIQSIKGATYTPLSGGVPALPEILILADATINTAPDGIVERHTTSETPAAGFGLTDAWELESAGANTRRVITQANYLTTATDAAETAERNLQIMNGGALRDHTTWRMDTASVPAVYFGALANGIGVRRNGTNLELLAGGVPIGVVAGVGLQMGRRLMEKQGAVTASASTLSLAALDGNYLHVSGTTTINYIDSANWVAGSRIELYFDGALTLTHNAASPPGGTLPMRLVGSINASMAAGSKIAFRYDSTLSQWVEVSRSGA